jgi:hypothetical protein
LAEEAEEPQGKAPAMCHQNRSITLCITAFFQTKKNESTKQILRGCANHLFSKLMVLFAVPDVQDASSNVSQPNTSSACKLFFGVWHTRIVVQQGLLCAATLSIF